MPFWNDPFYYQKTNLNWFTLVISAGLCCFALTWTPKMPKIMKKAQQITTMFPIGLSDDISVSTTSFSPGALLITLKIKQENRFLSNRSSLEVHNWFLLQDFDVPLGNQEATQHTNYFLRKNKQASKCFTKLHNLYSIVMLYKYIIYIYINNK